MRDPTSLAVRGHVMVCNLKSKICNLKFFLLYFLLMSSLQSAIERLATLGEVERNPDARKIFLEFREQLTRGKIRAAEKINGDWKVNAWVKQGILLGFRLGELTRMGDDTLSFVDKDTFPARQFAVADRVRVVPGGSSVREGAYVAPSVICMPPMFINVGAYVDEGTMVDSHALVGSCATDTVACVVLTAVIRNVADSAALLRQVYSLPEPGEIPGGWIT